MSRRRASGDGGPKSRAGRRPVAGEATRATGDAPVTLLGRASKSATHANDADAGRYLADASRALAGTLESKDLLRRLGDLVVPRLAPACLVESLEPSGQASLCAAVHSDSTRSGLLASLRARHAPVLDDPAGLGLVLRTRQPGLYPTAPPTVLHATIANRLKLRSALVIPLAGRDRLLALVTLLAPRPMWADETTQALLQDLADRAALAVDNARLFSDARRAVEMRDDVLAIASHDLASPLGAALLSAEALRRALAPAPDQQATRALDTLARAIRQMQRLVDDLGNLAAVQSGTLSLEASPTEVGALVQDAILFCEPMARQKSIAVRAEVAVPRAQVLCDRARTLQVLGSLLDNALKFSPVGGTVTVTADPLGAAARFSVRDQGPGIGANELATLFEPYYHDKSTRRMGRGLGLFISKAIVEGHRGRLWLDSEPGKGTTVSFVLPTGSARMRARTGRAMVATSDGGAVGGSWVGPFRRRARGGPSPSKGR